MKVVKFSICQFRARATLKSVPYEYNKITESEDYNPNIRQEK